MDHKLKGNGSEYLKESHKWRSDAPKFSENQNSQCESKTVQCFLRHGFGHRKAQCTSNKANKSNLKIELCMICGNKHVTKNCRQGNSSNKTKTDAFIANEPRATGRYRDFIVPVYVNSESCKALKDSRSSISIVRRDALKGDTEFTGGKYEFD